MKQDPAYLKTQSRRLHALYRRNQLFLNLFLLLWTACFVVLFATAVVDWAGAHGWGYSDDMWVFAGFVLFAPCFWAFSMMIMKFNLAYIRHTYGPETTE